MEFHFFFPKKYYKYRKMYGTGMKPELTRGIRTFGIVL